MGNNPIKVGAPEYTEIIKHLCDGIMKIINSCRKRRKRITSLGKFGSRILHAY